MSHLKLLTKAALLFSMAISAGCSTWHSQGVTEKQTRMDAARCKYETTKWAAEAERSGSDVNISLNSGSGQVNNRNSNPYEPTVMAITRNVLYENCMKMLGYERKY